MWSTTPHSQHARRASRTGVCGATLKRTVLVGLGALIVCGLQLASAPARAHADPCPFAPLSQPFAQWMDTADYVLAPDGGLEAGAAGWRLTGGSAVVEGNEPFQVGGATDHLSLALPAGSSATAPAQCTGREHRTIRFFARTDRPWSDSLRVDALIRTVGGTTNAIRIGEVRAGATWSPVDALDTIVNRMAVSQDDALPVKWRFTPQGTGNWFIDDVYIDPFRSN